LDEIIKSAVMPALVAGIHAKTAADAQGKAWMAVTSPAMTLACGSA
jgi:hypothetical protein